MAEASQQHKEKHKGGRWPKGFTPPGAKPWQPGVSPNPGGRPKGSVSLFAAIERELVKENGDDKVLKAAAKAYANRLKAGSFPHAKEIMERQDGAVSGELKVIVEFVTPRAPDADGSESQN